VDLLITDSDIGKDVLRQLKDLGVKVMTV